MPISRWLLGLVGLGCACGGPPRAVSAPAHGAAPPAPIAEAELGDRVGTSRFSTSCAPAVKEDFDRAVSLLHSFFYEEARRRFRLIAERDPGCAMAPWGVAM